MYIILEVFILKKLQGRKVTANMPPWQLPQALTHFTSHKLPKALTSSSCEQSEAGRNPNKKRSGDAHSFISLSIFHKK